MERHIFRVTCKDVEHHKYSLSLCRQYQGMLDDQIGIDTESHIPGDGGWVWIITVTPNRHCTLGKVRQYMRMLTQHFDTYKNGLGVDTFSSEQ